MPDALPPAPDVRALGKSFISAAYFDVPYASHSAAQKLDIYLPARGSRPYPVIVWMHPGGFHVGDKQWEVADNAEPMLARGYAVVSINYRLSGEAVFPAQIYDAKAAIRWIRAHAGEYGFDPRRIVAAGVSAGGYLAAMLGTTAGIRELEDLSLGHAEQSSRVNAVVDLYGPLDFLRKNAQLIELGLKPGPSGADAPEAQLLGCVLEESPQKCAQANPMTYIGKSSPPFYIQHGAGDKHIPYLQSVELAERLKGAIGEDKVHLELVPGAHHFDPVHRSARSIEKILDFLDRQLA